ncbi:DUF885 domain-containing protein [Sphingopyxis sp. MWB1]|uniref:DUF885 domain-containing protein n=1 Tax=Sphingopyxis sp. MWB1 TaxID=1537715 RepID=UPI001F449A58|nr:DUF885 domain-containing protein [Sphingopyxis sp. MWB1]
MGMLGAGSLIAWPATTRAALSSADARQALYALLKQSAAQDAALDPLRAARRGGGAASAPLFVDPLGEEYARALQSGKEGELGALARIDRDALTAIDRIAYDVLHYKARQTLDLFDSGLFAVQRRAALNPSFGLHVEFPDFLSSGAAPFETVGDYRDALTRMTGFADHMVMTITRLREGLASGHVQPRIVVDNILAQVDAMLALRTEDSPFWAGVNRIPDSFSPADVQWIKTSFRTMVEERLYPAYRSWADFLRQEYYPHATDAPGLWAMKDGDALYGWALARHTTTRRSAEDIHALGLQEVARIRSEMERVKGETGFSGDLKAFFDFIRTDPRFYYRTPEELLARFKAIEAKIWPAIPRLFHDRPRAPFEVRPLPALGDQRGTGYYRPGPPDGVSPGILFFNMSMLDTRPIPTLETLTLHEGIPGHHFQLTLAIENEDLPDLLRHGQATAYSEGWGLYAESLGPELGLFTDPFQMFGHLDMEMLRAIRLVVDTGLHAKQWSRERAIDYMLDNSSMARRDVVVEIDRYIAYPGQACAYKLGELKIKELRERARASLGAAFDIRDYHRQVLNSGALPLDVLEAKIDAWIAAGGGA